MVYTFDYIILNDDGTHSHELLSLSEVEILPEEYFVNNKIIARRLFSGSFARGHKPLYVGDIIKNGMSEGYNGLGEIVFIDSSFKIKWHDPRYISIRGDRPENIFNNSEIVWENIGNIFENSNLLIDK